MAARRIKRIIDVDAGTTTFDILGTEKVVVAHAADLLGETREAGQKVYDKLAPMAKQMMCHGMNARYGDSASSPEVDAAQTIQDAINQVVVEKVWRTRGPSDGVRVSQADKDLARAVADEFGKDYDKVLSQLLDEVSDEQKKALKKNAKIDARIKDIRAARAAEAAKAAKKGAKDATLDDDVAALFA